MIKQGRRRPIYTPGETAVAVDLGRRQLERMLPHRDPFLLLDGIDRVDFVERAIRGRRRIDPEDPVLRGHFPGDPVYPGVLLVEAIGQLGICLQHLLRSGRPTVGDDEAPRSLRLLKVTHALFAGEVRPGETIDLVARSIEDSDYVAVCAGQALASDGQVRALAVFEVFMLSE